MTDEFSEPAVDAEGNTPLDLAAEEGDYGVPDGEVDAALAVRRYLLPAEPYILNSGSHEDLENGACFNELASVLAGEPFSASPACVSPIVRWLGMRLNDRLDDERRQLLRPFVLRSLGTANDGREEERRQMCNEWLLHHALPDLLDRADKKEAADKLRALPGDLAVEGVRRALFEAQDEARDARVKARGRLRDKILAEMKKQGAVAGADAAADAAAVADAIAIADAAAIADAIAGAIAAADAAAIAAAGAIAGAAAVHCPRWSAIRGAVYEAVREKVEEIARPQSDELLKGALDLFDRMLPDGPLVAPVVEHAEAICAAPEALAA
jgi:hypothetical protein